MWEDAYVRQPTEHGFVPWSFMGSGRLNPNDRVLWHDRDKPERYHVLALEWGLPYTLDMFTNPNAQ